MGYFNFFFEIRTYWFVMITYFFLIAFGISFGFSSTIDVIGYYGNSGNAVSYIPTFSKIDPSYNVVIITFANFNNKGNVSFDVQGPYEKKSPQMAKDILAWKQVPDKYNRNKYVLVSIGGQNGNWPAGLEPTLIEAGLHAFMKTYHLDGFDIDLESSAISGASSLRSVIQNMVSLGKIVTAAPEAALGPLKAYQGILKYLSWVHPQFYNNGPNAVADPFLPSPALWPRPWLVSDWQDEKNNTAFWAGVLGAIGTASSCTPGQLGMLVPASRSAAGSYNNWNFDKLKREIMWAKISHVGTWAIAYDHQNNYKFGKLMASINDDLFHASSTDF